ncbi:MAG: hypothetical protein K8S23_13865 [Candidatus Cloacimonetes bacterium]|nr:hypothetical protein [Candidatus Cloacimonadota bacterium]
MGTQQILLIVLSVIIVGIAVAVGISMFNAQSLNSSRQAVVSDMNNYAVQAQTYYKTPTNMGGTGYGAIAAAGLRAFIGSTLTNDNGTYYITATASPVIVFGVTPNENGLNSNGNCVSLSVNVSTGAIVTSVVANPLGVDA